MITRLRPLGRRDQNVAAMTPYTASVESVCPPTATPAAARAEQRRSAATQTIQNPTSDGTAGRSAMKTLVTISHSFPSRTSCGDAATEVIESTPSRFAPVTRSGGCGRGRRGHRYALDAHFRRLPDRCGYPGASCCIPSAAARLRPIRRVSDGNASVIAIPSAAHPAIIRGKRSYG